MALTDVYISPDGAGLKDGSSVDNALQAIDSGDWSTDIEGLDRADKRFIFLEGTYNCTTMLLITGSAATDTAPNQWVGAKSDGTILRPKFDETGLRLDLTNYPKFVQSSNERLFRSEEYTSYKCLSFENTNASYSQAGVVEGGSGFQYQHWVGCRFKAAPASDTAHIVSGRIFHMTMCEMEATTTQYESIYENQHNTSSSLVDCRIIGGGDSSGSGDGNGIEFMGTTSRFDHDIFGTVVCNVHGHGIYFDAQSTYSRFNICNNTIVNCGSNGMALARAVDAANNAISNLNNNIVFGCGGFGLKAGSGLDRQHGVQLIAAGLNTSGNLNQMNSYEDMVDVVTMSTDGSDFVDYASNDFRIKRTSPLYKILGNQNIGAIQNEDYEFGSVS